MNPYTVSRLMAAGRDCALEMLKNASFIQRELPEVELPDALCEETEQLCSSLIGTKHDIMTELSELDDLLAAQAPNTEIRRRMERIARWLGDNVEELQALVEKLEAAKQEDSNYTLGWVLVAESAANVRDAFTHSVEDAQAASTMLLNGSAPSRHARHREQLGGE